MQPPLQQQLPQVVLTGPEEGRVADMVSVVADLTFARDAARTYAGATSSDPKPLPDLVCRALWSSAVIAYRRAFNSGRGHIVTQGKRHVPDHAALVDLLSTEQRDADELARSTADKHIAHRVSDLEQIQVFAVLAPPPMPPAVLGVANFHAHYLGPEPRTALALAEVCDVFMANLQEGELQIRSDMVAAKYRDAPVVADLYRKVGLDTGVETVQ